MARLSTHVLDLSRGTPAPGVLIDLYRWEGADLQHLITLETNQNGRTDVPLLEEEEIPVGVYELVFHAADYLKTLGTALSGPPFLDEIVIRFGISDPHSNCHVPLLLSPYGYSTYRGS